MGVKNVEETLQVVDQWLGINNILDLVQSFPSRRLYPPTCSGQPAVLRCEKCFKYLTKNPFSETNKWKDALNTAKKGIGR